MRKLKKCELDYNKTLSCFIDIADGGNVLSNIIINNIKFDNGKFYTLLPKDANFEEIYKFKLGGILPQNPKIEYSIDEKKATYSIVPTITEEISCLIKDYLHKGYCCIMDEVTRDFNNKYTKNYLEYLNPYIFSIKNEIIYSLTSKEISLKIIEDVLCKSRAIWHSLGILIDKEIVFSCKEVGFEELKNICINSKIIFVNAYDGEGYLFWEKNN